MKLTRNILALSGRRKTAGAAASAFAQRILGKRQVVWKTGDASLLRLYRPMRPANAGERATSAGPTAPSFYQTILRARTVQNFFQTVAGAPSASPGADASGRPLQAAAPALRARALQSTTLGTANIQAAADAMHATRPASNEAQAGAALAVTELRVQDLIRSRDVSALRPLRTAQRSESRAMPQTALRTAPRFRSFADRGADGAAPGRAPRLNAAEVMLQNAPPVQARLRPRGERDAIVAPEVVARPERAPDATLTPAALQLRPDLRALNRRMLAQSLADATERRASANDVSARSTGSDSRSLAAYAAGTAKLDDAQVASAVRRALEASPEIAPEIFIDRITAKLERRLRLEREWRGVR